MIMGIHTPHNRLIKNYLLLVIVKRTGSDWLVGPVPLGTGPQIGPVFTIKPDTVKIGQNREKPVNRCELGRSNQLTNLVFFFIIILVKMLLFLLLKKKKLS